MRPDADLIVLGGGCAGLSLGERLVESPRRAQRTIVLEARQAYVADRTWCFWRTAPHRHDALVEKSWSRLRLRSATRTVHVDCREAPYQMLDSGNFYERAEGLIRGSTSVELHLDTKITAEPQRRADHWVVNTSRGTLSARQIIDTRPAMIPREGDAVLWQSFLGHEVECDEPWLDDTVATLMDFAGCLDDGVLFHYVLPVSRTRALIETTVFGPRPLSTARLTKYQNAALDKACGGHRRTIVRSEGGVLPMGMTQVAPPLGDGYARAGVMSGGARASTGYAFQRIQRWARDSARVLSNGGGVTGHAADPLIHRGMDQLFLRVVRSNPEGAAELFLSIFGMHDPMRVIRFLTDSCSLSDYAAVIASLPTGVFLREMWSGMWTRSGNRLEFV
ncbi:lycopene cyclase family protein [Gemmatimonas sp.]|uniref:lycopene cyclase family protein n=3 Tax=Gemmatimonas sp. TaxID=1962908 RepID=UPI0035695F22